MTDVALIPPAEVIIIVEPGGFGLTGPKGDQGDIGLTGPQGPQGIQGIQGIVGPKGDQGDIGVTGDQGIQGIQGDKGDTGDTGPQGAQGATGATGTQGPQGIQGDTGPQGLTGPIGPQGLVGPQGIQGLKGDTGNQGVAGTPGTLPASTAETITGTDTAKAVTPAALAAVLPYAVTPGQLAVDATRHTAMTVNGLRLSGVAGDLVKAPSTTALNVLTGDLCVVVDITPDDWTPTGGYYLAARWGNSGARSWQWLLNVGSLFLSTSADGANAASASYTASTVTPGVDGTRGMLAFTLDVDTGTSTSACRFWTSSDGGTTWVQIGTTRTTAVASLFAPAAGVGEIAVGGISTSSSSPFKGTIHSVSIRNGIGAGGIVGGTEVARFDGTTGTWVNAVKTDAYLNAWTAARPAAATALTPVVANEADARVLADTTEFTARVAAITAEATARLNGIAAEATARDAAILVETNARIAADAAEVTARNAAIAAAVLVETNARLATDTYATEYPPVNKAVGTVWTIPSLGHSAQWSGTAWSALQPVVAEANLCCLLGSFGILYDAAQYTSGLWKNLGTAGSGLDMTLTATVLGNDAGGRPKLGFNGTSSYGEVVDASTGGAADFADTDSFTALAVISQATFATIEGILCKKTTQTNDAGWLIRNRSAVPFERPVFQFANGTAPINVEGPTATLPIANQATCYLAIRDAVARKNTMYVNQMPGVEGVDPGGSTDNVYGLRVARPWSGTFAELDGYVFGVVRRALTATERIVLEDWRTRRWA